MQDFNSRGPMIPLFRRFRVPALRSRLSPFVASAGCGANRPLESQRQRWVAQLLSTPTNRALDAQYARVCRFRCADSRPPPRTLERFLDLESPTMAACGWNWRSHLSRSAPMTWPSNHLANGQRAGRAYARAGCAGRPLCRRGRRPRRAPGAERPDRPGRQAGRKTSTTAARSEPSSWPGASTWAVPMPRTG